MLALLIALQSCLAGFAVCSNGGCCHAGAEAEAVAAHSECGHDEDHEHSYIVNASDPHSCDCNDVEIDGGEMMAGKRGEWSKPLPFAFDNADLAVNVETWTLPRVLSQFPRARGDTSQIQRLAIVRSTRLLL